MWVITLKSDGILCIDFTMDNQDHHMLPVFTSPDAAVVFTGGLEHDGEKIQLIHIDSEARLQDLKHLLSHDDIELILLDPPNLDDESPRRIDWPHWTSEEFVEVIDSLLKISEKHDEKRAIHTLDAYLHRVAEGGDPSEIDSE